MHCPLITTAFLALLSGRLCYGDNVCAEVKKSLNGLNFESIPVQFKSSPIHDKGAFRRCDVEATTTPTDANDNRATTVTAQSCCKVTLQYNDGRNEWSITKSTIGDMTTIEPPHCCMRLQVRSKSPTPISCLFGCTTQEKWNNWHKPKQQLPSQQRIQLKTGRRPTRAVISKHINPTSIPTQNTTTTEGNSDQWCITRIPLDNLTLLDPPYSITPGHFEVQINQTKQVVCGNGMAQLKDGECDIRQNTPIDTIEFICCWHDGCDVNVTVSEFQSSRNYPTEPEDIYPPQDKEWSTNIERGLITVEKAALHLTC